MALSLPLNLTKNSLIFFFILSHLDVAIAFVLEVIRKVLSNFRSKFGNEDSIESAFFEICRLNLRVDEYLELYFKLYI